MFHSATLKLTALYLLILAIICLFFSIDLYRVSALELNNNLDRQQVFFRSLPPGLFNREDFLTVRDQQIEDSQHDIVFELLYINIIILSLGGVGGYYLARRTLEPIEEAHQAQQRFTADASHELRTPIAAMQTELEVALRDHDLGLAEAKAQLRSTLEELGKLTLLSNNLLRLARGEDEKLTAAVVKLNLIAETAIRRIQVLADEKKITVTSNLNTNVAALGDAEMLTELLVILLDNAIKYSPEGTAVTISSVEHHKKTIISVADQGEGIKPSDLYYIFDRFYRADQSRSKTSVGGYGLGLAIAKNIVSIHQGSIKATSTAGNGTTFTIELPAA